MKINNKAFTLIELMIVVVILGVLMSTVLPKLTGAQARSRDAGRIADLGNIAGALQLYYDDNGEYDYSDHTTLCLDEGDYYISSKIKEYLQGQKVPQDPQPSSNKYLCADDQIEHEKHGRYWFHQLEKNGLKRNAFIICADMETIQKANTDAGDITKGESSSTRNAQVIGISDNTNKYEDIQSFVGKYSKNNPFPQTAEDDHAGRSVYCILRP